VGPGGSAAPWVGEVRKWGQGLLCPLGWRVEKWGALWALWALVRGSVCISAQITVHSFWDQLSLPSGQCGLMLCLALGVVSMCISAPFPAPVPGPMHWV